MFTNYLLLTIRTLIRNKISFIINLLGMGIALGCCIAAYINYEFNVDFDKQLKNASQLYRISFINESEGKQVHYGVAPIPMGELIRENFNEVDQVLQYISKAATFRIGDEMFQKQFVYANQNFTELFSMELIYGALDLNDKSNVLISDKLAIAYHYVSVRIVFVSLTQPSEAHQRVRDPESFRCVPFQHCTTGEQTFSNYPTHFICNWISSRFFYGKQNDGVCPIPYTLHLL